MEQPLQENVVESETEEVEIEDHQQTENVNQEAEGMNDPQWLSFLEGIKKKEVYKSRVLHFLAWKKANNKTNEIQAIIDYFENYKPLLEGEPDRPNYAPTTLRSWFSILCSFWEYTNRGELKKLAKLVEVKLINQWQKKYKITKAKTFSKQELERFFTLPNTPDILMKKVYAVVAIAFAARGAEAYMLTWDRVSRMTDDSSSQSYYKLMYERVKPHGEPDTEAYALISGTLENQVLDEYHACFTDDMKAEAEGRFLRKLTTSGNRLRATKQKVGKNVVADIGKQIAEILQLENPDKYTGHCWRRTSITMMTNSGMTVPQMKAISGHKSDSVLQGYIDHSQLTRSTAANAVAVGQKRSFEEMDSVSNGPSSSSSRTHRTLTSTTTLLDTNIRAHQPINVNVSLSNVNIQGPFSISLGEGRTMQGMSSSVEETKNA